MCRVLMTITQNKQYERRWAWIPEMIHKKGTVIYYI